MISGKLNETMMLRLLEWSYDKAVSGTGVLVSAAKLAERFQKKSRSHREAIEALINWQTAKCATAGFVTGLGGMMTLPFAVPANIASVLVLQLQLITAIAVIGGHDPHDHRVRSMAFICLTGSGATELMKKLGVRVGEKPSLLAVEAISAQVAVKMNQQVVLRLLMRLGKRGVVNFSRVVPVVGGLVCGGVDALSTRVIGKTAEHYFVSR